MFEYTIAAIPTTYGGIKYRSRLEARWAAFFDLLGWRHTYEPYEMGVWSPDFLIRTRSEDALSVLVEVKPIETRCDSTLGRMTKACEDRGTFLKDNNSNINGALLVGVAPTLTGRDSNHYTSRINLGWFINAGGTGGVTYCDMGIGWIPQFDTPDMVSDLMFVDPSYPGWWTVMTGDGGCWSDSDGPPVKAYASHTMGLWNKACNAVQWHRGT